MADEPARREVLVKFWEHPVLRTEEEIAELRAAHLLAEQGPVPGVRGMHGIEHPADGTMSPPVTGTGTGKPLPDTTGGKPADKPKEQ